MKPHEDTDLATDEVAFAPLKLNEQDYLEHLDTFDLTDAQKTELLQTLWNIMSMMVDIGWGVDSIQLMLPELFIQPANDNTEKGGKP